MNKFLSIVLLTIAAGLVIPGAANAAGWKAKTISAGGEHSCAIGGSKNQVFCWGNNGLGQLGVGGGQNSSRPRAVKILTVTPEGKQVISRLNGAISVSAGGGQSCAVQKSGRAYCWGLNDYGQLGLGTNGRGSVYAQAVLRGIDSLGQPQKLTSVKRIVTGLEHSCAIQRSGAAFCWGRNLDGELGTGDKINSNFARAVIGLGPAKDISVGLRHSCALRTSGAARCWGWNDSGQLGTGAAGAGSSLPLAVQGLGTARQISAGYGFTCARRSSGRTLCWGVNNVGQLGVGDRQDRLVPTAIANQSKMKDLSASVSHSCALTVSGRALCWGQNWAGQLGISGEQPRVTPRAVSKLGGSIQGVSAGGAFSCARRGPAKPSLRCWGWNLSGQLGNGRRANSRIPQTVLNP